MSVTQLLDTSHRTLPAHVAKRMQKLLLLIGEKFAVALVHAGPTSTPRRLLREIEAHPQLVRRLAVARRSLPDVQARPVSVRYKSRLSS